MSFLEKVGAAPLALAGAYATYKYGKKLVEDYREPAEATLDASQGYDNNAQALGAGLNELLYQNSENESFLDTTTKTALGAGLFGYSTFVLAGRPEITFDDVDDALEE